MTYNKEDYYPKQKVKTSTKISIVLKKKRDEERDMIVAKPKLQRLLAEHCKVHKNKKPNKNGQAHKKRVVKNVARQEKRREKYLKNLDKNNE